MAFDFNAVKDKNKIKHLSQQARTSSDQLLIYNFIEANREQFYIEAICKKRPIEYNDIKIYEYLAAKAKVSDSPIRMPYRLYHDSELGLINRNN